MVIEEEEEEMKTRGEKERESETLVYTYIYTTIKRGNACTCIYPYIRRCVCVYVCVYGGEEEA